MRATESEAEDVVNRWASVVDNVLGVEICWLSVFSFPLCKGHTHLSEARLAFPRKRVERIRESGSMLYVSKRHV